MPFFAALFVRRALCAKIRAIKFFEVFVLSIFILPFTWTELFLRMIASVLLTFAVLLMQGHSARAGGGFETDWVGGDKSKLRLITGQAEWLGEKKLFAGIEIRLAPKWKTYWRTPGDTGIPPHFDWSASKNLLKAEVLYPVPLRFKDISGMSIGYKSNVTLPVVLTAVDPSKPIELNLKAFYAICYDLCIPVEAVHSLRVKPGDASPYAPVLDMALTALPLPTEKAGNELGVVSVRIEPGERNVLGFKLKTPRRARKVDLFVEGPLGLYVPPPVRVADGKIEPGALKYRIDLGGVDDPQKFVGAQLVCTLQVDQRAVVQPCAVGK